MSKADRMSKEFKDKATTLIVGGLDKLTAIERLYTGYYNTDQPPSIFAEEFFFAVGEILENGKRLEDLELKHVVKEEL